MKHTLESVFGDSGSQPTSPAPSHRPARWATPTVDEVKNMLREVDLYFFSAPLSCAKRLAVGTQLRDLPQDTMDKLSATEVEILSKFIVAHRPLLSYMLHQRSCDLAKGKPVFIKFDDLQVLSQFHNDTKE